MIYKAMVGKHILDPPKDLYHPEITWIAVGRCQQTALRSVFYIFYMFSTYSCSWVLILTHCHNNSSHSRLSQWDHRHHQRPRTPTLKPNHQPGRVCHVQAETQQGDALVLSLHCPLNPLIITDTHISLTSPPPLSSDAQAKPAIGLKSAKHNPAILLVSWLQHQFERGRQQGRTKELVEASHLDPAQPLCLLLCQRGAVFSTVS